MFEIKPIFNAICRSKIGAVLLLIQIAITLAIVSNAAFIIHNRIQFLNQETGYPENEIFKFDVLSFGKNLDLKKQIERDQTLLKSLPNVVDATPISEIPLSGGGSSTDFSLKPSQEESVSTRVSYFFVSDSGLNTLGVKLIAGRNFMPNEVDEITSFNEPGGAANVVIMTKTALAELFPNDDPLGKKVYFGDTALTVIGVIDKMKGPWLRDSKPDNVALLPIIDVAKFTRYVVRTTPDQRQEVMNNVETLLLNSAPERVISDLKGLDEKKADYVAKDRLMMRMLVALISILVVVTALGIFGLTLFNISKRTKQIGTRRALGAKKSDIIHYFMIENGLISSAGLVLGTIFAILLGNKLMTLYSLPQLSLLYVFATALGIFVMSLIAVYGPAKRAANISPSIATRSV